MRTTTLLISTVLLGLMAGLFYAYAGSVMPALRGADDRTVVDVMQRINVAIVNPLFVLIFLGALAVTAVAAVLHRGHRAVLVPLVIALVLYAATLIITVAANIPLNNRLANAGPAAELTDPAAVREMFYASWVRWNVLRTLTNTGAFVAACWALVEHGRAANVAG